MKKLLKACTACGRHIRVGEGTCPFCNTELAREFATPPDRGKPRARVGRAAALVLGATAAAAALGIAASGCSADPDASGTDAGNDVKPDQLLFGDAYGLSFDGGPDAPKDSPSDVKPDQLLAGDAYGLAFDGGEGGADGGGD